MIRQKKIIKPLLRIGITGGIGAGKSEVCRILEELGEKIIYADQIAKKITLEDKKVLAEIRSAFGDEVFDKNNNLNRSALGDIVFSLDAKKKKLNSIIHPRMFAEIEDEINKYEKKLKSQQIFIEAAIIYEAKMNKNLDYIITVEADQKIKIERIKKRNNYDLKKILNIFKSQIPSQEKIKKSDFVIFNNGTLEELEQKVVFINDLLKNLHD